MQQALNPGDKVDRYVVEGTLGEGGMGRVYRARDERLNRSVALKVLIDDGDEGSEGRARLLREARSVATLDHANVVSVFDVGEVDGSPFIVMELVLGRSLREVAVDRGVTMNERLRCLRDVAMALAAAHEAGIIHRDVKPENVIVRNDGRVKVLDFGIARRNRGPVDPSAVTDASLATMTAEGIKVGTPMYMSPEQIRGLEIDGRADQFGWGVTAFEVLTGKPPWAGKDSLEIMAAVLTEAPPDLPSTVPAKLRVLIQKALAKKAEDRCSNMNVVVRAIDSVLDLDKGGEASSGPKRGPAIDDGPKDEPKEALKDDEPKADSKKRSGKETPPVGGSSDLPLPGYPRPRSAEQAPGHPFGPMGAPGISPMAPLGPMPQGYGRPTLSRRYSVYELEEVIDRALRMQPSTDYKYSEVVQAALEVGVDEPTLNAAMRGMVRRGAVPRSEEDAQRARLGFLRHMGIWLVVSFGLFLLNAFDRSTHWWFQFTMISWGVAVGIHWVTTRFASPRQRRRALHRHSPDPRVEYDAQMLSGVLNHAVVAGPSPVQSLAPRVRISNEKSEGKRVAPIDKPAADKTADTAHEAEVERELAELEAELADRRRAKL